MGVSERECGFEESGVTERGLQKILVVFVKEIIHLLIFIFWFLIIYYFDGFYIYGKMDHFGYGGGRLVIRYCWRIKGIFMMRLVGWFENFVIC